MNEHVKLPWRYQENSDAYTHIVRSGDRFILQLSQDTSGQSEATARFIVRACNSHEALVKALIATQGQIANAQIDLQTGHTKAQVVRTLGEIAVSIETALAEVKP